MADLTWPKTAAFTPALFEIALRPNVQFEASGYNGGVQTSEIPGTRHVARITLSPSTRASNFNLAREVFFAKLRGPVNRIVMGHHHRPSSAGTLTGSVLSLGAEQGDLAMSLTCTGLPAEGDFITLATESGPQWVMVTGVAAAVDGADITFSPPLRADVEVGSAVLYSNTTTRWVLMGSEVFVGYERTGKQSPVTLELLEVWA